MGGESCIYLLVAKKTDEEGCKIMRLEEPYLITTQRTPNPHRLSTVSSPFYSVDKMAQLLS